MADRIGFIGLGTMGAGMVRNLIKNKFNVTIYNRTTEKAQGFGSNSRVATSPADVVKDCDIIFTCVSNDPALEQVLFEKNGVFEEKVKGKIIVDTGTTSIELTEKIINTCKDAGASFIDAPITGSRQGADTGTLMFMIGANKDDYNKVLPAFEAMGKKFVLCGDVTFGQRAKVALNLTQSLILQSYIEGITLAHKNGVPIDAIYDILQNSGAKSGVAGVKIPAIRSREFEQNFKLALMTKDLRLAESERNKMNLKLPLTQSLLPIFEGTCKLVDPEDDFCSIAKLCEKENDMDFTDN